MGGKCPQVGVVRFLTEVVNLLWLKTCVLSVAALVIHVNEEVHRDKGCSSI